MLTINRNGRMPHGHGGVVFFIKIICNKADHWFRDDLTNKYGPAFPSFPVEMLYIKPQVNLFKIDMEWPFYSKNFRVPEHKTHHAHQGFALPQSKNSGKRQVW